MGHHANYWISHLFMFSHLFVAFRWVEYVLRCHTQIAERWWYNNPSILLDPLWLSYSLSHRSLSQHRFSWDERAFVAIHTPFALFTYACALCMYRRDACDPNTQLRCLWNSIQALLKDASPKSLKHIYFQKPWHLRRSVLTYDKLSVYFLVGDYGDPNVPFLSISNDIKYQWSGFYH